MKPRQALVCGDCGAVIEDGHLPEEEDWACPECGRGSNLELTLVVSLRGVAPACSRFGRRRILR